VRRVRINARAVGNDDVAVSIDSIDSLKTAQFGTVAG